MPMRNFIVSAILVVLMIVTAILREIWFGFSYFTITFVLILAIFWMIIFILNYINDYVTNFEQDFKMYCIKLVNSSTLSLDDIEKDKNTFIKEYKKTLIKYKVVDIIKILVSIVIALTCIYTYFIDTL